MHVKDTVNGGMGGHVDLLLMTIMTVITIGCR